MPRRPLQKLQASLVARRFYIEQQTKSQIADELGISRFKVARLLDTALADGIVRIEINDQGDINTELAEKLRRKFGLKTALVLDGPDVPTSALFEPLGLLAADFLEESLLDGQLLGISWGRTLASTAKALTQLPKVDVVQAGGSPAGLDLSQNPTELVHRFARASGGVAYPLFGPMWVDDADLITRLRNETSIASAMSRYDKIDVLAVGIGSWRPQESCLCSGFPDDWRRDALKKNVCADLCATLIDENGASVPSPLDETGLCLSTAQLRRIPERIGIGGGLEKADAIKAVLKGNWITTLVTDAGVARRLTA
ncbi:MULTISPECIES: sugar-binding transcriptional regulator [Rhizobium]|uniref:sugar-binding transcriptional regulator n=1 Tax=Rhizobium TaxID=379 RepID=UPI00195DCDC7|nr:MULTISPECIES: sugar-binding domain-containing protein [Rhizobium]MBM7046960.1 DNA-binding transcriptional regulator [Rhizobium lusitanum]